MKATVIGITGAAGAGKGTISERLGGVEVAFADPLYEMLSAMTGIPVAMLKDRAFKEAPIPWLDKSPRQLLQTLGTEWGRKSIRPDVWLLINKDRIWRAIRQGATVITVPDVRFNNEAEMLIRDFDAQVWEAVRPNAETCVYHASEAGIDRGLIHQTLFNRGTLEDFYEVVDAAFQRTPNATMKDTMGGIYRDRRVEGCAG